MKKKDLVFDQSKAIISKVAQIKILIKKAVITAKKVEGSTTRNDRKLVK